MSYHFSASGSVIPTFSWRPTAALWVTREESLSVVFILYKFRLLQYKHLRRSKSPCALSVVNREK